VLSVLTYQIYEEREYSVKVMDVEVPSEWTDPPAYSTKIAPVT